MSPHGQDEPPRQGVGSPLSRRSEGRLAHPDSLRGPPPHTLSLRLPDLQSVLTFPYAQGALQKPGTPSPPLGLGTRGFVPLRSLEGRAGAAGRRPWTPLRFPERSLPSPRPNGPAAQPPPQAVRGPPGAAWLSEVPTWTWCPRGQQVPAILLPLGGWQFPGRPTPAPPPGGVSWGRCN